MRTSVTPSVSALLLLLIAPSWCCCIASLVSSKAPSPSPPNCSSSLSAELFNTTTDSTTTTRRSPPLLCAARPAPRNHRHATSSPPLPQDTMCLERVTEGLYFTMAAHPDGSGRAFLSTQDGKVWLALIPVRGSGATLNVDGGPFLDLTDRVHYDGAHGLGLMGVAFHPRFATNGRFFVSYTCDSSSGSPTCGSSGCSAAGAAGGNGSRQCRYQLVVAEFAAEGNHDYSKAARADPSEVRRIFAMALPHQPHASYSYKQQYRGQLLFRPTDDGHLYLVTGSGDLSRNKKSFLGKIIRFDVDHMPSKREIVVMGPNNLRGCSFDSEKPSYFYCAHVDHEQNEAVLLISEGRNYSTSSAKAAVSLVNGHSRPAASSMPSIIGGVVYRGFADPSLRGRYLYMYGSAAWAALETPGRSRRYASARIPNIRCCRSTPLPCSGGGISGRVLSFGEGNSKDLFVLATSGMYRIIGPDLCGDPPPPSPPPMPSRSTWLLPFGAFALAFAFWQVYLATLASNGQAVTNHIGCCGSIMCCVNVTNNNYGVAEAP